MKPKLVRNFKTYGLIIAHLASEIQHRKGIDPASFRKGIYSGKRAGFKSSHCALRGKKNKPKLRQTNIGVGA